MFLEDSDFEDNEPKAKSKSESKRNDKGMYVMFYKIKYIITKFIFKKRNISKTSNINFKK